MGFHSRAKFRALVRDIQSFEEIGDCGHRKSCVGPASQKEMGCLVRWIASEERWMR